MTTVRIETFDFDVALSYASEDRVYVQQVVGLLQQHGTRVFYDECAQAELWGNDLCVLLDEVYRKRARFAVVFVSRHYASKPWTHYERASVQARALAEVGPYLLPVQLDDSELPGLRPTIGYVDARRTSVERLVWLIEQKLLTAPGKTTPEPPVLRSPRTIEEQRELLALRPDAWEYLLYAGVLWQRRCALESKWRDHEFAYARPVRQYLDDREARRFVLNTFNDLGACGENIGRMLDPVVHERAFGPHGQPGDPVLIEHIATRLIESYEEILDLAATLRGVGVSREMAPIMEAMARLTDIPLEQIRDFIEQVVAEVDNIPELLALDKPVNISLTLTLTIDEKALKHFKQEMRRVRRKLKI